MARYFLCCVFLLSGLFAVGQPVLLVDSLNALVSKSRGAELNRVLDNINDNLSKLPREEAFRKAHTTLKLAQESPENFAVMLAMRNLSHLYVQYDQQMEALQNMQDALEYARETADSFTLALTHYHTAEFYREQKLFATALEHLLHAQTIFDQLNDHRYAAGCMLMAGNIHFGARNYIQAIEECQKVVQRYERIPIQDRTPEDDFHLMNVNNTLGLGYYKMGEYEKSLASYNAAEVMARQIKNEFWLGLINGNRAVVYKEMNLPYKALDALRMDYTISKKHNEFESASRAAATIAEMYLQMNDLAMAEQYLDSAKMLVVNIKQQDASFNLLISAKVKRYKGDLAGAFDELSRYNAFRDSVLRQSEALNLTKVKASYELERKQQEIEAMAMKSLQASSRIRFQNLVIITTAVILMLLLVLVIVYVRNVKKLTRINSVIKRQHSEIEYKNEELEAQSARLKEANELAHTLNTQLEERVAERTAKLEAVVNELDTFLYRSSHDMRRPLSTLLGLENIARLQTKDAQILQIFEMMADTVRHMDSMLLKLQMAYELEQQSIERESVPVIELVADQIARFQRRFTEVNWVLENNADPALRLHSSAKLLTIVFKNLLENAVNFRKTTGTITPRIVVQVYKAGHTVQLIFTDNGIGIEQQYQARVFEQYFKATELSKGNGLGLYLVKKALEKVGGSVSVKSQANKGSTFTVMLPFAPDFQKG
jgi:signal transduction histidine kinase